VNARIPGQGGLGDACGVDATRRLVQALAGWPLEPQPVLRPGVGFARPDLDARVFRRAAATLPARERLSLALRMARAYPAVREFGWFDVRDPGPGLSYVELAARTRIARLVSRRAR
jgi:hypothetical protein